MLITTTDTLQGVEITEYIGLVTVRVENAKALKDLEKATSTTISSVNEALTASAEKMGANAVAGLKITPEAITTFAVGTAVKVK